jgi:hypothetical protein
MSARDRYHIRLEPVLGRDEWEWWVVTWTVSPTISGTSATVAEALSAIRTMIEHHEETP